MYVPVHEREKANSLLSFCLCIGYRPHRFGLMTVWRWEVYLRFWCLHRLFKHIDYLGRLFIDLLSVRYRTRRIRSFLLE